MTHTPEQWNHGKLGNNADQWDIYDEAGRTIGLSYHGEDTAKLFASAPDLLAALQRAAPWLGKLIADKGHENSVLPSDAIRTLKMVEAAISKATE